MTKRAGRVLVIVLVCLALFILYLLRGMSGGEARVEYTNGGALVAYFLDQELQMQGKSLDEIRRLLNDVDEPITTDVFLQELEILGGAELARECEDLVYGRCAIPHP